MAEPELENLLADYAAPIADDGFSDRLLAELPGGHAPIYAQPERTVPWRGGLIALCCAGIAGGVWSRLGEMGVELMPKLEPIRGMDNALALGSDPALLAGFGLAAVLSSVFALQGLCGGLDI